MVCTLTLHTDSGLINTFKTEVGTRLIDAIATDHSLNAPCGGRGTCGKCRVRATGKLSQSSSTELGLLTEADVAASIRLACLTTIEGDAEVWLTTENGQILTDGAEDVRLEAKPVFVCEKIFVPQATLDDQSSDEQRLSDALSGSGKLSLNVLKKLPGELKKGNGQIWIVRERDGGICDICADEPRLYAAAIDIGTTTLAAYMLDLQTGKVLTKCSAMNPQRGFGADVISRIDYSRTDEGLKKLQNAVVNEIGTMVRKMLGEIEAKDDDLRQIVCVGNTVMVHLFLGVSPENIAVSPFIPVFAQEQRCMASELGLPFGNTVVETGPCVAGYIGADTTAAALACAMNQSAGTALLIDIGTNGEIALGNRERIVCCSAAAGPAFEGAHIRCGSGAVEGAISSVQLNDDGRVLLQTIGDAKPTSICGSGLVDAIAEMLRVGILDETGRIDEDEADEIWEDRIFDSPTGLAFALTEDKSVYICQKDVREVQLAKGAIAAGIQILMKHTGVGYNQIEKLFLAGGFGNYIDVHNACAIGLLPSELEHCAVPVGNAAGSGAKQLAINTTACSMCSEMASNMEYIELSSQREFTELFSENMLFEI